MSFGSIPAGSCDLTTYAGCTIKTVSITNSTAATIVLGGYGVRGEEVALVPVATGECITLPLSGTGWALAPGASCFIGVTMGPVDAGPVSATLFVLDTTGQTVASVRLIGVGR